MTLLHKIIQFARDGQGCGHHNSPGVHPSARIAQSKIDARTSVGAYSQISNSTFQGNISIGDHSAVMQSVLSGNIRIGRYTSLQ